MYGFACLLWVRCEERDILNNIKKQVSCKSCKKERSTRVPCERKGRRSYDTFRIISYWNAEIYDKRIEVPPVSARTLKTREREIGITIKLLKNLV